MRRAHYLVKKHLHSSNVVVSGERGFIREVIHVEDLEEQFLSLLELVRDVEALDPLRVQVVHDNFRASELDPFSSGE